MGVFQKLIQWSVEGHLIQKLIQVIDSKISSSVRFMWAKFQKIDSNKIVFMTYSNKYECNPKYIAEELIRRGRTYELVWIIPPKGKIEVNEYPPQLNLVRRNSFQDAEARATAKIWIENAVNFTWDPCVPKKRNQIYLNTWHGSMGLKRIGKEDQKDKHWVRKAKKCGKITNYCISDSTFEDKVFRSTYWGKATILRYGHARNDILFNTSEEEQKDIRYRVLTKLKVMPAIPENFTELSSEGQSEIINEREEACNTHYVLYAPTFRDNGNFDCYNLDFKRLKESLHERFGGQWEVLMRFHFHNRNSGAKMDGKSLFINATNYPDMQELMYVADVGITDYSSWICDFTLTGKPGFIYAVDIEKYNNERSLYYPLEILPFPLSVNNDEINIKIRNFDIEQFEKKRTEFLEKMGCIEDGYAAKRIADLIDEIMKGDRMD